MTALFAGEMLGASPHTRGWTPAHPGQDLAAGGFPAHAGMDLNQSTRAIAGERLPRTRGDGPATPCRQCRQSGASPHTRGWTPGSSCRCRAPRGFPAHAGMDPARCLRLRRPEAASPHTRGWTQVEPLVRLAEAGFPAHAGMDLDRHARSVSGSRLPRTRGDGPLFDALHARIDGASPHTRGWTPRRGPRGSRPPGFPAHAGMDLRLGRHHGDFDGLPRTRGDGPRSCASPRTSSTASPHTRGWTRRGRRRFRCRPGFPAHAGMDPPPLRARTGFARLPRTRGDGPHRDGGGGGGGAASPHTRGWTRPPSSAAPPRPGFPAHAGMDPDQLRVYQVEYGLPRTRGDGPQGAGDRPRFTGASPHTRGWTREGRLGQVVPAGASPHTRGWTRDDRLRLRRDRGFPAHAGMDPSSAPVAPVPRGLPRTRGDGPCVSCAVGTACGASPHTRGWTLVLQALHPLADGFPAHAGMDPFR